MATVLTGSSARSDLWAQGQDVSVQVNQRALIDKILARYSGEYTIFRELLQNADDAGAHSVKIRFYTAAGLEGIPRTRAPDLKNEPIVRNVFLNDGMPFRPEDWSRLREIAAGNPSDDKIGAFGVGFYSLFSITESPLVESGDQWMGFYWKDGGDQLFARSGRLDAIPHSVHTQSQASSSALASHDPNQFISKTEQEEGATMSGHPWTKFTMDIRSPIPLEGPLDFARFLVTSLTFMKSMRKVEMWVDDWRLLEINKGIGTNETVDLTDFKGAGRGKGGKQGQATASQQQSVPGGYLSRLAAAGKQYGLPQSEPELDGRSSPGGVMHVQGIDCTGVKITAKVMRMLSEIGLTPPPLPPARPIKPPNTNTAGGSFGSMISSALFGRSGASTAGTKPELPRSAPIPESPKDSAEMFEVSMDLKIYGADVRVHVDPALGKELERATKKAPPKRTTLSLIYSAGGEGLLPSEAKALDAQAKGKEGEEIFAGLKPELDGNERTARIFIGQATGQTTGIAGHIAARFIPTVERESIDLQDRHVSVWNKELLYVGGYLARVIYELELQDIKRIWNSSTGLDGSGKPDEAVTKWLIARGLHALRFFTFYPSTPSPTVGRTMEAAWHGSLGESKLPIVSTSGVMLANAVRMPHPTLLSFLPKLAVLPEDYPVRAEMMIGRLRERGMISDITLDDVIDELGRTPLDELSMVACLKWWQGIASLKEYKASLRTRLLDAAVLSIPDSSNPGEDLIYPLSQITTYLNTTLIPSDVPLPPSTIPYSISKQLKANELQVNFDWTELSLNDWLEFLLSSSMLGETAKLETNVLKSTEFAEKVIGIIGRAWQKVPAGAKTTLCETANEQAWLPTREGPRIPKDAYFADVDLFPDLPIISLPNTQIKGNLRAFLAAAGVRSHVELQLVFSRLVGSSKWSCFQLIAYLVKARSTLSDLEIARLKKTAAFPVDDRSPGATDVDITKAIKRVTPDMIYEPTDSHRQLGLDVLDWGTGWKPPSEEAKFMFMLGLKRHPVLTTLLKLAADPANAERRTHAFDYLVKNISFYNGFNAAQYGEFNFVPAISPSGQTIMASPTEAFLNPSSSLMGFPTVAPLGQDVSAKLKLIKDVPTDKLVTALIQRPPGSIETATKQYEYLQSRLPDFWKEGTLSKLGNIAFIRTANERPGASRGETVLLRPSEVFFRPTSESTSEAYELYKAFFHFIDFGKQANAFLEACGVKQNPSVDQLANLIVQDPRRFLKLAGTSARYLAQLRLLASSYSSLPTSTKRSMTNSPFLLAGTRVSLESAAAAKGRTLDDDHDDGYTLEFDLAKASEICIVDEVQAYNLFSTEVKAAPQEEVLEDFYEKLGAQPLSALVKEETKLSGTPRSNQPHALRLRTLILERLALFFTDRNRSSSDVSLDWLRKEGHLTVFTANSIHLRRTYRQGQVERTNSQAISAAVMKGRGQVINMYISEAMEIDMFEVALALTKALFKRVRPDEPLLLMTILTTPLSSLKRRGYNVDRILNQQKAERLAREAQMREQEESERKRQSEKFPPAEKAAAMQSLKDLFPNEDPAYLRSLLEAQDEDHLMNATNALLERNAPSAQSKSNGGSPTTGGEGKTRKRTSSISSNASKPNTSSLMGNLRQKFRASSAAQAAERAGSGGSDVAQRPGNQSSGSGTGSNSSGWDGNQRSGNEPDPYASAPTSHVTPYASIKENALRAVAASRPDTSREIASQPQRKVVKESEGGYCDTTSSGVLTDLIARGSVGGTGVKLFISRDVKDPDSLIQANRGAFLRFAERIIIPLSRVFKLEAGSSSIFYDSVGPLIAFNRGGSLYFNARYYIAWHDAQVQQGDLTDPLISWYFTAAHEAAHNIVADHNSEHEFYFSSIAETFMMELTRLIQSGVSRTSS